MSELFLFLCGLCGIACWFVGCAFVVTFALVVTGNADPHALAIFYGKNG